MLQQMQFMMESFRSRRTISQTRSSMQPPGATLHSLQHSLLGLACAMLAHPPVLVPCRPTHVQISDIVSYATYQASATNIARVLKK